MKVCRDCGTVAEPKTRTKGSFWIEVILWICFLIPGLIYSIWRLSSRSDVCRACGSDRIVPINTPVGRQLAGDHPALRTKDSTAARNLGYKIGRVFAKK